jgi:hypothetical protein
MLDCLNLWARRSDELSASLGTCRGGSRVRDLAGLQSLKVPGSDTKFVVVEGNGVVDELALSLTSDLGGSLLDLDLLDFLGLRLVLLLVLGDVAEFVVPLLHNGVLALDEDEGTLG